MNRTILPKNFESVNVITIEGGVVSNIKTFVGGVEACGVQAEKAFAESTGLEGDDLLVALDNGNHTDAHGTETILTWSDAVSVH